MAVPTNRLVAAAAALLVTVAIVGAIVTEVGNKPRPLSARPGSRDSYCAVFAAATALPPAAPALTGRYANPPYGYALTIPAGLRGFAPAEGSARDIVIPLSARPRALLRVDASYDQFYDITAAGVHTRDSVDVRLFDQLLSDEAQPFALGGVDGSRYRMGVLCRGDPTAYVFEDIVVVRNREIYRLVLQTEPSRLPMDEAFLDALARGWSWTR